MVFSAAGNKAIISYGLELVVLTPEGRHRSAGLGLQSRACESRGPRGASVHSCITAITITDDKNNYDGASASAELEKEACSGRPQTKRMQSLNFRSKKATLKQDQLKSFIHCPAVKFYTLSIKSRSAVVPARWGRSQAAAPGDQQGQGLLASRSTVSPLLSRKASCLGSRPRNFLNISEASSEPPGRRMYFL